LFVIHSQQIYSIFSPCGLRPGAGHFIAAVSSPPFHRRRFIAAVSSPKHFIAGHFIAQSKSFSILFFVPRFIFFL
jgi:hypothetical protein